LGSVPLMARNLDKVH